MSLSRLVLRNIAGGAYRSWVVFLCASVVAAFAVATTLVIRSAEAGLRLSMAKLGAEVIIVPWKTDIDQMQGARLMSPTTDRPMPRSVLARAAAVPGVAAVSPQYFLAALPGAPFGTQPEVYLIAYEPETDFALKPWLERVGQAPGQPRASAPTEPGLRVGDAIAGSGIGSTNGRIELETIGYTLTLRGKLAPTGTGLDQSLFVSFETAQEIATASQARGSDSIEFYPNGVSAVLVKVSLDSDPHQVAVRLMRDVPGVMPIESTSFFRTQRRSVVGLTRTILALAGLTWACSLAATGFVFSVVVNQRRQEIGVLRALGSTRAFVLRSLLTECAVLALGGGVFGIALLAILASALGGLLARSLGLTLLLPSPVSMLALSLEGLILALASVTAAVLWPILGVSRLDPALAMRE